MEMHTWCLRTFLRFIVTRDISNVIMKFVYVLNRSFERNV